MSVVDGGRRREKGDVGQGSLQTENEEDKRQEDIDATRYQPRPCCVEIIRTLVRRVGRSFWLGFFFFFLVEFALFKWIWTMRNIL